MSQLDPTQRSQFAAQILENPVFKEAFGVVRQTYVEKLLATAAADQTERDRLYHCIHALADVQTVLTICVEQGKIENMLAEKQERAKK